MRQTVEVAAGGAILYARRSRSEDRASRRSSARLRARIKVRDHAGNETLVWSENFGIFRSSVGVGDPVPEAFALMPASPNPFRTRTAIRYATTEPGAVRLVVFDAAGREVRRLVDTHLDGGRYHEATWDGRDAAGRDLPQGIYYLSLRGQGLHETRKVVRLR